MSIIYHLEQALCSSNQVARDRHVILAMRSWRRFLRAVKLALALTVLAALLLAATLPAGAQGPWRTYRYWYLQGSEYHAGQRYCNYRDGRGFFATWPAQVSAYSGKKYCPSYRVTW